MTFDELFRQATGNPEPYPYQRRFATGDAMPQVLSVPTGVGKTATAVLGWLWRRRFADDSIRRKTPRRLVYCLPMRTLVEQTRDECVKWLNAVELFAGTVHQDESGRIKSFELDPHAKEHSTHIGVHILMGGEDGEHWDEFPERDAIIIGTQDMLLSRALNRGYGMSRYRWPMHFGLLNNDCLWVLDETQLMGVGLTTSCQLAGLRAKLATYGNCQTLWMSATLDNEALGTIDHPQLETDVLGLTLDDQDKGNPRVERLLTAGKPLSFANTELTPDSAKKDYEKTLAEEVAKAHQPGTLTLVVLNNVARSQKFYTELSKLVDFAGDTMLVHSRFRQKDRAETQAKALAEDIDPAGPGRIVIATQAIEAGVDISATTMFTELAPWSSLVQRFGRCNRRGTCGDDGTPAARVFGINIDVSDAKKAKAICLPYEVDDLIVAHSQLEQLDDVGPRSLENVILDQPRPIVHVLRRKDLIDLFDTTPDLSGNDLDVSRYIRDSNDTDVQVYWRDWDLSAGVKPARPGINEVPKQAFPAPRRNELCSVAVHRASDFVDKLKKKQQAAWAWDPLTQDWSALSKNDVRPGMTVLLHCSAGGYNSELGWTGDPKHRVEEVPIETESSVLEAMSDDDMERSQQPVKLTQHLLDVLAEAQNLRQNLQPQFDDSFPWEAIETAALWHDVGKAHEAFQTAMHDFDSVSKHPDAGALWAKPGQRGMPNYRVAKSDEPPVGQAVPDDTTLAVAQMPSTKMQSRRGFRHELVSALAWLHHNQSEAGELSPLQINLIAYLIAAHHGKVRLSIRSMPNEPKPDEPHIRFARGVWDGDELPSVDLGNGEQTTAFEVSLDLMALGESEQGPSWLARMLALRDEYGPFRLAWLETLLRISDWRGSANPGGLK